MMKQIEAFVQSDKLRAVVDAIEKKKVGGVSVIQARGRGKGHRPEVGEKGAQADIQQNTLLWMKFL